MIAEVGVKEQKLNLVGLELMNERERAEGEVTSEMPRNRLSVAQADLSLPQYSVPPLAKPPSCTTRIRHQHSPSPPHLPLLQPCPIAASNALFRCGCVLTFSALAGRKPESDEGICREAAVSSLSCCPQSTRPRLLPLWMCSDFFHAGRPRTRKG